MPYTFGGATSDRITWTAQGANGRANFIYGWWLPTTLTAGRRFWSYGDVYGAEIDTTTTQVRMFADHATDGQWTTGDAGLATNKWSFLAFLWSQTSASGVAWRVWSGSIDTAPTELTVTTVVAPSGGQAGATTFAVGNKATSNVAFQGDIAEVGYANSAQNISTPPFFISTAGAISDAEADFVYRRLVLPTWLGNFPALYAAPSGVAGERARIVLDTLPAVSLEQRTVAPNTGLLEPTISGATVSKNGHPRGRSVQLLAPIRPRR